MSSAGTTDGHDKTFTTSEIPLKFVMPKPPIVDTYGSPFSIAGTLSGTGAANHPFLPQANPFPYVGSFDDVDKPASTNASGAFSMQLPGVPQTTEIRLRTLDPVPTYSKAVTVQVAARVTIRARKTKAPGWVQFSGTVEPTEVGAPVVIERLKPGRNPANTGRTIVKPGSSATLCTLQCQAAHPPQRPVPRARQGEQPPAGIGLQRRHAGTRRAAYRAPSPSALADVRRAPMRRRHEMHGVRPRPGDNRGPSPGSRAPRSGDRDRRSTASVRWCAASA